ncbi:MAG TPA: hypothetical protein VLZ83_15550 [Edaphocola sp.]|nr:hypothetical protein [Edaphocola sp.]
MNYFLKEVVGVESNGMDAMANNLPQEFSFLKGILGGANILFQILGFLPFIIIGFIVFWIFKKKWKSLNENATIQSNTNIQDKTIKAIIKDLNPQGGSTTTFIKGKKLEANEGINQILQNSITNAMQGNEIQSNASNRIFPGIVLPMNGQQNNITLPFNAPTDIMLNIQASAALLNELKEKGIPAEATIIEQNIVFENVMPDIDAIKIRYQLDLNEKDSIENSETILTRKSSLSKTQPGNTIHVIYSANNPRRVTFTGTDKQSTTTNC